MPDWNVSADDQRKVALKLGKTVVELTTDDAFELGWALIDAAALTGHDGEHIEAED